MNLDKFNEVIKQLNNISQHRVLVAVSTGVDSMVLLHAVECAKLNFGVVHINHSKREQSEIEADFIKNYCINKNIPFYFKKLDEYHGSNFQEWARIERYNYFYEVMDNNNYDYLLLAHHADDNLETVIMRFFKKSSLKGLSGISEYSTKVYNSKEFIIYRPLIELTKDYIYDIAKEFNIKYYEDSSNQENDYDRNKIRHNLIPVLKEFNPNIYDCLKEYSYNLSNSSYVLEEIVDNFIQNKIKIYKHNTYELYKFNYSEFIKYHSYIQKEILFTLLKRFSLSIKTIDEYLKEIEKSKVIIKLNKGMIIKEYNFIKIVYGELEKSVDLIINQEGVYSINSETKVNIKIISNNTNEKVRKICYNSKDLIVVKLPFIIRKKSTGDKIVLKQGTVSVSNFLTNKKINYLDRENTYCILDDKDSNIINQLLIYKQEEDI